MQRTYSSIAALFLAALIFGLFQTASATESNRKNAIEFCPVIPLKGIWGAQYSRRLTDKDNLLLGLAYMHIPYDSGRSHAPTLMLGYRRHFWKGLHLEYMLMPSYNWYHETTEDKYYNSPELWNEFRPGYTINTPWADRRFFIDLQCMFGFIIYPGDKPESFKRQADDEPLFISPIFFLGWRF